MSDKPKNVTFTLPIELVERYREYAKNKWIPSVNAGVREALEQYSASMEKQQFRNEMKSASEDTQFIEDLQASQRDLDRLDEAGDDK